MLRTEKVLETILRLREWSARSRVLKRPRWGWAEPAVETNAS